MIWSGFVKFLGIVLVLGFGGVGEVLLIIIGFVNKVILCFGENWRFEVMEFIWVIELIFFCWFFRWYGKFGSGDVVRLRGFTIFFLRVFFLFGLDEGGGVGVFVFLAGDV